MKQIVYGLEEINSVVEFLFKNLQTCNIITFTGPLGAGKTTLVRALLERCGIQGIITSPTFNYVNVYKNGKGHTFYHFDLYRIKSINDFLASGFDEYLHMPDSFVFIEWPEIIMPLLKHSACQVIIEYFDEERILTFKTKTD
jgi:tRNA threonylcarbamoyladenosine biosynthesis protein TsaE